MEQKTETTSKPTEKKSTKVRKLSKKQKGFIKDYIDTGNGTQSALNNYDTDDYRTANSIAVENLQKPAIIKAIQDSLPDDLLAQVHLEGLAATELRYGEPDYGVRHKYLDSAYKLKGSYAPDKSVTLNVTQNIENREKMEQIANEAIQKMLQDEIQNQ